MNFSIQRTKHEDIHILSVSGCMGDDECYRLENELSHLLDEKHRSVVLDCSGLSFGSAISLARLLTVALSFHRRSAGFRLAALDPSINRLGQAVGFTKEMTAYADVSSAINSLRQSESPRSAPKPPKKHLV